MSIQFRSSILTCSVALAAILSACGGGGSNTSSNTAVVVGGGDTTGGGVANTIDFTIEGVAAKGLLDGARVIVIDGGDPLALELADLAILGEDTTAADGRFSIDVQDSAGANNLLVIALMNDASMKCDSAIGCGLDQTTGAAVNFGDNFSLGPNLALLTSYISTPTGGTVTTNLNTLSTLTTSRMIGLSVEAGSVIGSDENTQPILRPQDQQPAQDYIAQLFGITSQDYSALDFVDITEPLPADVDQAELQAAILSSGVLAAAVSFGADLENNGQSFTFDDLFDEVTTSFFVPEGLIVRESPPNPFRISLAEIFGGTILALDANVQVSGGTPNNAQDLAIDYLVERANAINAAPPNTPVESDGSLPQPPAEISFISDSIQIVAGTGNQVVGIDNPDGLFPLTSSQGVPIGEISFFADVTSVTPPGSIGLNLFDSTPTEIDFSFGADLAPGTYEAEVTFTVSEFDQTYTDLITINVESNGVGIVQESVTMTTAADSSFRLDFVNPNNVIIAAVFIDNPNGPSFFEPGAIDDDGVIVGYGPSIGSAPAGTYNVNVTLSGGLGAEANDVTIPLEIIVTQE